MVSTVPTRTPLGAATTNRKWYLDVRASATDPWLGVHGITEFKPNLPGAAGTQDDSDFDGGGFKSDTVTTLAWGGEGKVSRKRVRGAPTAYDPGQELIRTRAAVIGGELECRIYEMEPDGPRVQAWQGFTSPRWSPDGGGMDALDTASFTLAGRGAPTAIDHPEDVTAVPIISSILPSGAAAGASVVIEGDNFTGITGAAGVKFGGTNASSYNVLSDETILAVVPAGSAGDVPVVVGTSEPTVYTRGA